MIAWATPVVAVTVASVTRGRMLDPPRPARLRPAAALQTVLATRALLREVRERGPASAPATPAAYILAAMAGGALLYVIMMYAVAPKLNPAIVEFTARTPFFTSHLVFGAIVGAYVYWRSARGEAA